MASSKEGRAGDLEAVRLRIDTVDRQIVELLANRQRLVIAAGALKTDEQSVRAPARVEQVIAKVREFSREAGASADVVEQTYRAMIGAFIELELSASSSPRTSTASCGSRT